MQLLQNPLFWLSTGLILIILELIVPGVYLLWIGLGAILVALPTYVTDQLPIYGALLFLVPSVLLTVWIGILWQRKAQKEKPKVNLSLMAYEGTSVRVVEVSKNKYDVRISLAGTTYPARSDTPVKVNE